MIVVADTSPLNYLILVGEVHLLPTLFETVLIPSAVGAELQHPAAPEAVRTFIKSPPNWLILKELSNPPHPELAGLDRGESEAIQLAFEHGLKAVLIDDAKGRAKAMSMHLGVVGTVGILELGAKAGKVDLLSALNRLSVTNFRLSKIMRLDALKRASKAD